MKSIKLKIILPFTLLITIALPTVAFLSINSGTTMLTKEAENSVQKIADEGAKLVESRLTSNLNILEIISIQKDILTMDWEKQLPILKANLVKTSFLDLAVVYPDGNAYYTDGTVTQLGDRAYIKKAFQGEANVSDIIISRVTNQPVLMLAYPILKDNKVIGVLIGRRDGNALSDITMDTGYGEQGYSYMINNAGTVIAHPKKEYVLDQFNPIQREELDSRYKSLSTALKEVIAEKSGHVKYTFSEDPNIPEKKLFAGFAPIVGTDWFFIIIADEKEVFAGTEQIIRSINLIATVINGLCIIIAYLIGRSIAKPIVAMTKQSEKISNLDLTSDIDEKYLKKKDEIGVLARSLKSITVNLRGIVREITDSAVQVASTAEELTATSQQSAIAAEEVSKTVEEIAKGASEQASNTEKGSLQAINLGELIVKNSQFLEGLNSATYKVAHVVDDGIKDIKKLSQITEESKLASNEINEIILKTSESAEKINEASNIIASIASQTNLLALNASIEAARAGEAGKGFAVVASEIKKLAGQSATSTSHIDDIVQELKNNVSKAVDSVNKVLSIAQQQSNSVNESNNKFKEIQLAIVEAQKMTEQLTTSGEEMTTAKNDILDMLQTLSAIAEENAAGTEEASSSMEEESASIEEIARSSEKLAFLANDLQSIILKFKS